MKGTKKMISVLLSICMLAGLLPAAGFAAGKTFAVDTVVEAEAGTLGDKVVKGKDKNASGGVYIAVTEGERV